MASLFLNCRHAKCCSLVYLILLAVELYYDTKPPHSSAVPIVFFKASRAAYLEMLSSCARASRQPIGKLSRVWLLSGREHLQPHRSDRGRAAPRDSVGPFDRLTKGDQAEKQAFRSGGQGRMISLGSSGVFTQLGCRGRAHTFVWRFSGGRQETPMFAAALSRPVSGHHDDV